MISLAKMGSFFVGGRHLKVENEPLRPVSYSASFSENYDPNGSFVVEAAYVQFFVPAVLRFKTPLLLIHGGGLTGAQWESTPDGRPGWIQWFLEAGVACYIIDNVERGRAGFCAIEGEWPDRPLIRSTEEAIRLYRLAYPGNKFPIEALDHLTAQSVPRWLSTSELQVDALTHAIDRIGDCALLGFSQGGGMAFRAADRRRGMVRACLSIEPHGVPAAFDDGLEGMPAAMVLGDFIEEDSFWNSLAAMGTAALDAWRSAGGTADIIRLPEQGITGNTHMMMMDTNSHEVFAVILQWLDHHLRDSPPEVP